MAVRSVLTAAPYNNKIYRYKYLPRLMSHVLRKNGWRPRSDENDTDWSLFWKNGRFSGEELREATLSQHKLNHFPETFHLTKKGHLQFMLKSARLSYGDIFDFFPSSYVYTQYSKTLLSKYFDNKGRLWIGKPAASSQGRGIHITDNLSYFNRFLNQNSRLFPPKTVTPTQDPLLKFESAEADTTDTPPVAKPKGRDVVVVPSSLFLRDLYSQTPVQEYIKNPLLIEGYKHDLRIYVLVTSFKPLRAYLYLDGLARFCTKTYSTTDFDLLRHLTNTSIHTKVFDNGDVSENEINSFRQAMTEKLGEGDLSKWRLRSLLAYFKKMGINHEEVWNKIRNVIRLSLLPLAREFESVQANAFELFGFDILLTDDLSPKLIEVNLAPSLGVQCLTDRVVKEPMLVDLLDIVFEDPNKPLAFPRRVDPIQGPNSEFTDKFSRGDYELLFPFNHETLTASSLMAANIDPNENMALIINEIRKQYKTK